MTSAEHLALMVIAVTVPRRVGRVDLHLCVFVTFIAEGTMVSNTAKDEHDGAKRPRSKEAGDLIAQRRLEALRNVDRGSVIQIDGAWSDLREPAAQQLYLDSKRRAGIAFSGGGIRSATLSLGFAEALSARGRLYAFDIMSTVSGGGYCGAFLRALFVERDEGSGADENAKVLSSRADFGDATLRSFPDQQFFRDSAGRTTFLKPNKKIKNPMWWLRENGRYLAPGGMSDYRYALSYIVRNWLTLLAFTLGCMLLVFGALQIALVGSVAIVKSRAPEFVHEVHLHLQAFHLDSPLAAIVPVLALIGIGIGAAYWLTVPLPFARPSRRFRHRFRCCSSGITGADGNRGRRRKRLATPRAPAASGHHDCRMDGGHLHGAGRHARFRATGARLSRQHRGLSA